MNTGLIIGIAAVFIPVLLYFANVERKHRQVAQDRRDQRIKNVVDRYLGIPDAKRRTGVHDLIASGVLDLEIPEEILEVCAQVSKHGRPSPLHTLATQLDVHLDAQQLPKFFRWFAQRHDLMSSTRPFHNEKNFAQMIGEFEKASPETQ